MTSTTVVGGILKAIIARRPQLGTRQRLTLWCTFLGLTTLILLYPVDLRLEYAPVESLNIFSGLRRFVLLFYLWTSILLVLVFTSSNERSARWERLALTVIGALVFWGFWALIAPIRAGGLSFATTSRIWQNAGQIIQTPYSSYYEWPGHPVFSVVISEVTGLDIFSSITLEAVFTAVLVGTAGYVFLLTVLKSSLFASLACLIVFEGSLATVFINDAAPMGLALATLILVLVFRRTGYNVWSSNILVLILLTALAISHFFGAGLVFFILAAQWAYAALKHYQGESVRITTIALLSLSVPVAWILHGRFDFFTLLTGLVADTATNLNPLTFLDWFGSASTLSSSNFSGSIPAWIGWPRLFLAILTYGFGGLLWLRSLIRFRRLGSLESQLSAAFGGFALLTVGTFLMLPGSFFELRRPLGFGIFLPVPFLFLFLQELKPRLLHKALLTVLAVVLIAFSFPGFLSAHRRITSEAYYAPELAGGAWLQSVYGTGKNVNVYVPLASALVVQSYLTHTYVISEQQATEYFTANEDGLWQAVGELLTRFELSSETGNPSIFYQSPKPPVSSAHFLGVSPDHPNWDNIAQRLSTNNNVVYDNGTDTIYARQQ